MSYIAEKRENKELNGIELYFAVYPLDGTKQNLKKYGFRWNRKKACWYAKQNLDTLNFASICAETTTAEYEEIASRTGETVKTTGKTTEKTAKAEKKPDTINLDNLGVKPEGFSLHGAELAAFIRADLKKRGVSGVTVRARSVTYSTGITVTIRATANEIASVEEMKKRYTYSYFACETNRGFYNGGNWVYNFHELTDEQKQEEYNKYIRYQLQSVDCFSTHWNDRDNCPELTTTFYNKCLAVFRIANQWNYDNSDSMTDYFDVGYYLDIDIKKPENFQPRENMTDEEKTAYKAEKEAEEAERAATIAKYEQEQKEADERRKAYEAQRKIDRELIKDNITVEDLTEEKQLYITDLVGGIGKESNLKELEKEIAENPHYSEALITRKVVFGTEEAYNVFTKYLIDDFDFIKGKGGTASEDVRLEGVENVFCKMNEGQRRTVKMYMNDCVAIYLNNDLMLVSNPEGYSYSRYTYKPTKSTIYTNAAQETEKQRKESETKTPFYFPESVEKQSDNIREGQKITVYQTDGWNLCNVYGGFGAVLSVELGTWAQYKGVYITLIRGGKGHKVFIRDNKKCLIYDGILPPLPDSLTKRHIDDHMSELLQADEIFPAILDYYSKQGKKPILDTIQR